MRPFRRTFNWCAALCAALMLVTIFLPLACSKKQDKTKEMKIGAIFPLSGSAQRIGNMKKDGAELAIQMINSRGGVNGAKLIVLYEDSMNDPTAGLSAFNKLVSMGNIKVIMSAMSGVSMALAPLAEREQIVLFANVGHPQITKNNKWVFRNFPTAEQEARVMVSYLRGNLHVSRAAILYPNDDWGLSGRDAFKREFTKLGGPVVLEEAYEKEDSDFKTQLVKIKNEEPDVLYFTGFGNALGIIARQGKELGIECIKSTTTGFNDKAILDLAGEGGEGVYLTTSAFDTESTESHVKEFVVAFEEKFGRRPAFDEALQYDTVRILSAAIAKGGNEAESIRTQLSMLKDFTGVCGRTSVTEIGDFETPIIIRIVHAGKLARPD